MLTVYLFYNYQEAVADCWHDQNAVQNEKSFHDKQINLWEMLGQPLFGFQPDILN